MAYDQILAQRIRTLVAGAENVTEKKMFGGLALLVGGHMAVAASAQGGIMVRVDPAQTDAILASTKASVMEMRGRQMPGWLRVGPEYLGEDSELAKWVEMGVSYAQTLPAK